MLRSTLGDFCHITCIKAIITGMEDALGERAAAIALIAAGRTRGKLLAQQLSLIGTTLPLEDIAQKMRFALGEEGTRLCLIEKIIQDGDLIKVYTSETLCSTGESQGSTRKCSYTLGAIWGAVEQIFGKRFLGQHAESVLRGGQYDVFEFTPMK